MGYPLEFRNNVVRSILSDGTRISDAAKEYQVARVTIYSWLKVARQDAAAVSASNIGTQNMKVPLPEGVDFNKMYDAYVVCRHLGFDSTEAGQYCRREGLLLADVKAFAGRQRKKVLTDPDEVSRMQKMLTKKKGRVKELEANYRLSQREIERKDKVTAELSALLVLTKKAQAIWGDKEN